LPELKEFTKSVITPDKVIFCASGIVDHEAFVDTVSKQLDKIVGFSEVRFTIYGYFN
jgi:predicted Zn-dependent peptidase